MTRNHGNFICAICGGEFAKSQHNQIVCQDCRHTKKKLNQLERRRPEKYPRRARPEMSKSDKNRYIGLSEQSPCDKCVFAADCRRCIWDWQFSPYCAPLDMDDEENWRHDQFSSKYPDGRVVKGERL